MLAKVRPEWAIDLSEAQALAGALANYLRHTKAKMDPKTQDLIALIGVVIAVEGTRLIRISGNRKAEASARHVRTAAMAQAGGTVVNMDGLRP